MTENLTIGLDLGGTTIQGVLFDSSSQLSLKSLSIETQASKGKDVVLNNIVHLCQNLSENYEDRILAIGLGIPGCVHAQEQKIYALPNLPFLEKSDTLSTLSQLLKKTIFIENDANCAALGEHFLQKERGGETLCITLGTGIGGGIILKDHIFTGHAFAGEIGHMVIKKGGRPCGCGRQGCFERYASRIGIEETYTEYTHEKKSCKDIFDDYRQRLFPATHVVQAYVSDLACGLTNLIHIFDISTLILAGGVSQSSDVIIPLLEKFLEEEVLRYKDRSIKIKASQSPLSGAQGAAIYALQRLNS